MGAEERPVLEDQNEESDGIQRAEEAQEQEARDLVRRPGREEAAEQVLVSRLVHGAIVAGVAGRGQAPAATKAPATPSPARPPAG